MDLRYYVPPQFRGAYDMAEVAGGGISSLLKSFQSDPVGTNKAIGRGMIEDVVGVATDPVGTVKDFAGTVGRGFTYTAADKLADMFGIEPRDASPDQLRAANKALAEDRLAALAVVPGIGPGAKALTSGAKMASRLEVDPNSMGSLLGNVRLRPEAGERFEVKGSDFFPEARVGGRGKDPALYTPFSGIKSATPPALWTAAGERQGNLLDAVILDPSDFKNKRLYFATGDRTTNQDLVQEINDYLLRNGGQATYGGPRYMDQINRGVWASEFNPMKAKSNAWKRAAERDEDYLAAYMPMGERSGDFSKHMSDVYGGMIQTSSNRAPWKRNVRSIDEEIAKKFPSLKDRPSFGSPAFPEWLSSQKGGVRASLIKFFDSSKMQKLGLPEVGPARFAITEPDLMLSDTASIGYRFGTPKRGASSERTELHPSYNAEVAMEPGTQSSTLGFDLPWLIGARDSALPKAADLARKTGKPDLLAKPKDVKSYMGNPNINQLVDDQWVEEASLYREILNSKGKAGADDYVMSLLKSYMAK
jgi:hypothetical protein